MKKSACVKLYKIKPPLPLIGGNTLGASTRKEYFADAYAKNPLIVEVFPATEQGISDARQYCENYGKNW